MTRPGDLYESPVTHARVLVRVGGEDTDGRYVAVDTRVASGPEEAHDVVLFSSPPRWVQRAVFALLAPVARLCGVGATYTHHGPLVRRQVPEPGRTTRLAA